MAEVSIALHPVQFMADFEHSGDMVGEMGGNAKPSSVCWIFWWEDCGSE
jgi:hypothetical protein